MKKRIMLLLMAMSALTGAMGQQYIGTPGLLHVPTADMDTVGLARVGVHYVPKSMIPDGMKCDGEKFNSMTNYLSLTPFSWLEVGYGYTLWKLHKNRDPQAKTGFYAKDRYFTLRVQPLHEARWWPSVVVGANDVWGSSDKGHSGSNYYRNYYAAVSKHVSLGGHLIGGHLTYRTWKRDYNHKWDGLVGGLSYQPAFYRPLRVVAEWDGTEANVGVDCRVAHYFLLQCGLLNMRDFNAGLTLCLNLL